jgi:23S rRNA (cytidine1920-2'-O)/16S rRNA (cytidine1409-2'-O)-methyltransferase
MTPADLTGPVNFASIDVSFISLRIILPPLIALLHQPADIVALIKPQFEAGREKVGKSGVVRDPATHKEVLQTILTFAQELGLSLQGLAYSPITGGEGNIEFLAHWRLEESVIADPQQESVDFRPLIDLTVNEAGQTFNNGPSRK